MKPPRPPPPPPAPRPAAAAGSALAAALALLLLLLPLASAACTPPEAGPYTLHVAPGEAREFAGGLAVARGERVLVEGTLRIAGGLQINGTLFLSSTASATLSADWVAVGDGGALVAGSEACPLPPGVVATLELRDGAPHPLAGRKALAILPGGTLEANGGGAGAGAAPEGVPGRPGQRGRRIPRRGARSGAPAGAAVVGAGWQNSTHPPTHPPTLARANAPPPAAARLQGPGAALGAPGRHRRRRRLGARAGPVRASRLLGPRRPPGRGIHRLRPLPDRGKLGHARLSSGCCLAA